MGIPIATVRDFLFLKLYSPCKFKLPANRLVGDHFIAEDGVKSLVLAGFCAKAERVNREMDNAINSCRISVSLAGKSNRFCVAVQASDY